MKQNWEIKKLSEIGKIYNGNSINESVKKEKYTCIDSGLPYIATKDISYESIINYHNGVKIPFEEKASFKIAPINTVLICAEGGSAGRKIGFTNHEICFGNKLFALVTNKNIDSRFVYYYYFSSAFQKHFAAELVGIIGGVSMNKFKDIEIPIPSLREQQRIVVILDEAFTAITKAISNAQQNLQSAKELFDVIIDTALDGNNDDWEEKRLEELLEEQPKNGWSPPAKNHSDIGIPVLTLSAVTGFDFKSKCVKYTNAIVKSDAVYWVKNGDLLITRSNTPELVGHVAICKDLIDKTIYPDLMMKINPNKSIVSPLFLYHQLKSKKLRRAIMEAAHGANPTMKKINKQDVQNLKIKYPILKTQLTIVQKIDTLGVEIKKLEAIYQQKINDLVELKKAILQKAFSGELKTKKELAV